MVGKKVLEERDDAAAANQGHEDAGSGCSVFAEPLDCEVEDRAPHDGGAKAAEHKEPEGKRDHVCTDLDLDRFRNEDGAEKQADGHGGHHAKHHLAADLGACGGADQTADEHAEPVESDHGSGKCGTHVGNAAEVDVSGVGDTDLDAHIEEDSDGSEHEMTEA